MSQWVVLRHSLWRCDWYLRMPINYQMCHNSALSVTLSWKSSKILYFGPCVSKKRSSWYNASFPYPYIQNVNVYIPLIVLDFIKVSFQKLERWIWCFRTRNSLVENPGSIPSTYMVAYNQLQLQVTRVQISSSDCSGYLEHTWYTYIHAEKNSET